MSQQSSDVIVLNPFVSIHLPYAMKGSFMFTKKIIKGGSPGLVVKGGDS